MEKKHQKYVLIVPDVSQENPHAIMYTRLCGAILVVRAEFILGSALGIP